MFDLDGTLVDSVPDLHAAVSSMLRDLGEDEVSIDQVTTWVGNGAAMLVKRALSRAITVSDTIDSPHYETAYEKFISHYHLHNGERAKAYPHVAQLIDQLKQQAIKLAIVTNKPEQFTLPLLNKLNIAVDLVLSGDSLSEKKPHPAPLLHCLEYFGLTAADAIMIGDSVSDISAARAANVPNIAVSYGYNHGQSPDTLGADKVIDSLEELIQPCG